MTIPITPGPFAFLADAGKAVGDIGTALLAKKQRLDTEARQRLTDILSLINSGADPTPFLDAGGAAAEHLKLAPPGQGTALLSGPAERARLQLDLARSQGRKEKAGATTAEAGADVAPGMAAAGLRTAQAGATSAEAGASAAQSDLHVRTRINDLVVNELQNPESDFGKLAARAAAGTLPYYSTLMQVRLGNNSLERERMRELNNLFMVPFQSAPDVWKQRVQTWDTQKTLETSGMDANQVKEWEKAHPKPEQAAVLQELLEAAARNRGLTPDQYNQALNESVGLLARVQTDVRTPQKVALWTRYVNEIRSGKRALADIEAEITQAYRMRGTPSANFDAQLDIAELHQMLEEAQNAKPSR